MENPELGHQGQIWSWNNRGYSGSWDWLNRGGSQWNRSSKRWTRGSKRGSGIRYELIEKNISRNVLTVMTCARGGKNVSNSVAPWCELTWCIPVGWVSKTGSDGYNFILFHFIYLFITHTCACHAHGETSSKNDA